MARFVAGATVVYGAALAGLLYAARGRWSLRA
jgi:hypothetical protein